MQAVESVPRQYLEPQAHVRWDIRKRRSGKKLFDHITRRVSALGRNQCARGQTLADTRGHFGQRNHDLDAAIEDIGAFKTWVVGR